MLGRSLQKAAPPRPICGRPPTTWCCICRAACPSQQPAVLAPGLGVTCSLSCGLLQSSLHGSADTCAWFPSRVWVLGPSRRCLTSVDLGRREAVGGPSARACRCHSGVSHLLSPRRAPWGVAWLRAEKSLAFTRVAGAAGAWARPSAARGAREAGRRSGRQSEGARFRRLALSPVSPVTLRRLLRLNKTEEVM